MVTTVKKSPEIPKTSDEWTALIGKLEPRFPSLVQKAGTRRGLTSILRLRFRAQLHELQPSDRRRWLDRRVTKLLSKDLDERVEELFIRTRNHGDKAGPIFLIDEEGRFLRNLFRPMVPTVALKGVGPETALPITLPLPQIQRQVTAFVQSQRQLLRIRVPRGKKPGGGGDIGGAIPLLLAYLADTCRQRKADLLRLVDRDISTQNYRWLTRRLVLGRHLLTVDSEFTNRVKVLGMDNARWFLQGLLGQASFDPDPE
jgi:hypothetical protein